MIRPATRADIATIRERLAGLPNPPYLPSDDDVAELFEDRNTVAFMGDAGEFGQAYFSEVNGISTIVYLLPEGPSIGRLGRLLMKLLDGLWEIAEARDKPLEGIFHSGLDPATGREDFGLSKAEAWKRMVNDNGRFATGTEVDPVRNSAGVLVGHRIFWTLEQTRRRLRGLLRGN